MINWRKSIWLTSVALSLYVHLRLAHTFSSTTIPLFTWKLQEANIVTFQASSWRSLLITPYGGKKDKSLHLQRKDLKIRLHNNKKEVFLITNKLSFPAPACSGWSTVSNSDWHKKNNHHQFFSQFFEQIQIPRDINQCKVAYVLCILGYNFFLQTLIQNPKSIFPVSSWLKKTH